MKKLFLTSAMLFIALITFGQNLLPSDPAVKIGKLDNGLTYYIRYNAQPAQRAEFYLATNVGAFQEADDQDGLAHFLEHMCFNGTKNFPGKGILEYLQSIGAEFGRNINASTGFEQTSYMLNNIPVIREGIVDSCLMILRDYSHYVTCDPKEIDAERGVILEERRSRRTADWRMLEQSLPYYFGNTQMARRTLIGAEEQLKTFKYESLVNFYRTWYNPDMQAVVVVGDVDVDKVEEKIKTIFGEIPAPAQPTQKPLIEIPENETPDVAILTDPEATSSMIEILWRIKPLPREFAATDAAFVKELMERIVRLVMSERLRDITSNPDAPFLSADFSIAPLCASSDAVQGSVVFKDGEALSAFRAYLTEIEKMKRYGFNDGEIERAKEKIKSHLEKSVAAADSRKNSELVQPILNSFFDNRYNLDPNTELQLTTAFMGHLNAPVLRQVMSELITDKNCVVISKAPERENLVQPTKEELLAVIEEVKNSEIAANVEENTNEPLLDVNALKGTVTNNIKNDIHGSITWELGNGVKVVFLKTDYKKDQILVDVVKEGGRSLIETNELASFDDNIWTLFQQNTGISTFANSQLRKMLAGKNVYCNPYISSFRHGVMVESTPKDLETALQLLYLTFENPRFDDNEFQLGITQINAVLPNLQSQPSFKFQEILRNTIYGNNPRQVTINNEVVANANIETIEKVYRRLFDGVAGATVYIVGNVETDSIIPLIEKYVGSISSQNKAAKWIDREEYIVEGNVVKHSNIAMETPKSTVFQFYTANMPCSVKNEVMLDACKQLLDMVFTETLRESEGGTYGVGVSTLIRREPKEFAGIQVFFETNPEQALNLAKMAHDGVVKVLTDGVPSDKLSKIVENFKKNIPEQRISNKYWMSVLKDWNMYACDYDKEYEEAVSQITPENMVEALGTLLNSDNFIEIIMSPTK